MGDSAGRGSVPSPAEHLPGRCTRPEVEETPPSPPLVRYADDILLLCRSDEEAQQVHDTLTELLQPTGMQLKGTYLTDTANLRTGQRADWLGNRLGVEGGRTTVRVSEKFPAKLHHHLATALAEADVRATRFSECCGPSAQAF
jgi:hypothetical protein